MHARLNTAPTATTWYVARSQPRMEWEAMRGLERAGYRAWFPHCWRQTRHARKTSDVRRPVFPGYVFLGLREGMGLFEASTTRFVHDIVTFNDEPVPLPPKVMRCLMDRCDPDGWWREADDHSILERFEIGQQVRFTEGPLEGLITIVAAIDGRDFVEVEAEILGSIRRIKASAQRVEPVSP